MVKRSALGETLGRDRMAFNLDVAVARYLGRRPERERELP